MIDTGGSLMQQCSAERVKAILEAMCFTIYTNQQELEIRFAHDRTADAILEAMTHPVSPEQLNAQIAHDSAADAISSGQGGAGFLEELVTAQTTLAGHADPTATPTAESSQLPQQHNDVGEEARHICCNCLHSIRTRKTLQL